MSHNRLHSDFICVFFITTAKFLFSESVSPLNSLVKFLSIVPPSFMQSVKNKFVNSISKDKCHAVRKMPKHLLLGMTI